jgi:hypothetical protein
VQAAAGSDTVCPIGAGADAARDASSPALAQAAAGAGQNGRTARR